MTKESIFKERNRLALKKQNSYSTDIKDLSDYIDSINKNHPYCKFTNSELVEMGEISDFFFKKEAIEKKSIPSDVTFLYRIIPASRLGKYTTEWLFKPIDEYDFYDEISKDFEYKNEWIPLGNYLKGFMKNSRGFSWWTDVIPKNIEMAYQLGLVSEWLHKNSLILRISVKDILNFIGGYDMPSVIDGYMQPIFFPKEEKFNGPGQALNINDRVFFKNGFNEYLLPEINVKMITAIPLFLDIKEENSIFLDDIEENLLSFYKTK